MNNGFGRHGITSTRTGMAGNLRVASELLLRGFDVSIPYVDTGVDLYVSGCVRIQVKSAHLMTRQYSTGQQPTFNFFLAKGPAALGGGLSTKSVARIFSAKCDFVVLWGIEQNRFWIVPAALLDNRMSIALGPDIRWVPIDADQLKAKVEAGMTQREIAAELGVCEMTISRRMNQQFIKPSTVIAAMQRIKETEGRWDLLQDYIGTMNEAVCAVAVQEPIVLSSEG